MDQPTMRREAMSKKNTERTVTPSPAESAKTVAVALVRLCGAKANGHG
ncbi:hypothetical protein [Streptomyces canus]|nr:hypothetical protein [Streptomyces canus]